MSKFARITAVFLKEIEDIRRNPNILVLYALPVLLTLLWNNIMPGMPPGMGLSFGLLFLVVMVGMYVPSMMIAEEKEKKTIEVLLLSPATPAEVIIGKGFLTLLSIILVAIFLMLITGFQLQGLFTILLATVLTSIFAIFVGMIVGLLAKNQMSTGVVGMPVYLLLLIIPQVAEMAPGAVQILAGFLPTYHYLLILDSTLTSAAGPARSLYNLIFIAFSSFIVFLLLLYVYKIKGLKN